MFKATLPLGAAALILATSTQAMAEQKLGWHGSGEAGYNGKTGNTVSENLFARLKVNHSAERTEFKSLVEAENKSESNIRTSERYVLDLQGNYYFSQARDYYSFANARGEKDRFADIDLDYTLTLGLGKQFLDNDTTKLSGEAGLGYQDVSYIAAKQNNFNQTSFRAKLDFKHAFNDIVSFHQDALYFAGEKQYKVETNSSIQAALNSRFSVSAGYKYRYTSKPAAGKKKEDGETLLSLIYKF